MNPHTDQGRRLTDPSGSGDDIHGDLAPSDQIIPSEMATGEDQQKQLQSIRPSEAVPKTTNAPPTTIVVGQPRHSSAPKPLITISPEVPVTKTTLSELDVPKIVYNPKLRHDINFDPDLHFRPNSDGDKGRKKKQKADEFWDCLKRELGEFTSDQKAFTARLGGESWCLPLLLKAIGEILATLVPPEDRTMVEEILNVPLLMQQLSKGVADLDHLAKWLSRTLKSHCAPMRDEWVDDTVAKLSPSQSGQDTFLLVEGLQALLGVLEAMKLDVANHQIRCLRPLLIQDSVEFEQTFFVKKIATGKIDVVAAHNFYNESKARHVSSTFSKAAHREMWIFFEAFMNLLRTSNGIRKSPDTFMFDEERILKLRAEILDASNLELCLRFYRSERSRLDGVRISSNQTLSGRCTPLSNLVQRHAMKSYGSFEEETRSASPLSDDTICLSDSDSSSDSEEEEISPRQSFIISNMSNGASKTVTSFDFSEPRETPSQAAEKNLRQSILAILEDIPLEDRWQQGASAIALQILRFSHGHNIIPTTESREAMEHQLRSHLGYPSSTLFHEAEKSVVGTLAFHVDELMARYHDKSSKDLFQIASAPRPSPLQVLSARDTIRETAKQIVHIGILHWRVWSGLVYLVDPEGGNTVTTRRRTAAN